MPRRTRRRGGSDEDIPKLLTKERLREIIQHLKNAQGVGEFQNVISDILDIRKSDPQIFSGPDAEMASESLDSIMEEKEDENKIRSNLAYILSVLNQKLLERQGGRRGRKSRRKTLRQRK